MSSTWVAEFDNEKDYKHFVARFNEIAPNGGNVIVPELSENPEDVRLRGAWVDLDDDVYVFCENFDEDIHGEPPLKDPAWAISFDIAIWDDWTKDFIKCIMQEMCHRYSFIEIGCNSVDLISAEEFMTWKCFSRQRYEMDWLRKDFEENSEKYKDEENFSEKIDKALSEFQETEDKFREAAKRFFDGDASDLILSEKGEPQLDFRAEIKGT